MKPFAAPFALPFVIACALSLPAMADDTTTSGLIRDKGLAVAETTLDGQPPSNDRDMALTAVRFLMGIEAAYQARWRVGSTEFFVSFPILGTELIPNPSPEPLRPDFLNVLATDLSTAMEKTRDGMPDEGALVLELNDLWFDMNSNGTMDDGEQLLSVMGMMQGEDAPSTIRFDTADLHWLRAYSHLIEGMAQTALAFNPEPVLERRIAFRAELERQHTDPPTDEVLERTMYSQAQMLGPIVDDVAAVVQLLRQTPDKPRIAAAADHFRQMIAANRTFWSAVETETDDDREWIPNDRQKAALGFELPPGTATAWQEVLSDAEAVLDGTKLVPFWRFAPGHGIDLAQWIKEPGPIDLMDWVQGSGALPYAKDGETVDRDNWDQFASMLDGDAFLYMVLLN
ncbi:MAG: hypothetical protein DI498_02320 [Paracoccus denitrificans]|nr:MAG: hypothetical protein DI498_02320 [Paracoccus denitrificans]PZO85986.1 MAG: hypothetical protein DI633_02320 [Paracoccus denitrificans]